MIRRTAAIGLTVLVAAISLGLVLGSVLRQGMSSDRDQLLKRIEELELQNAEEVQEHRKANQSDHDCIVALALLLADPSRDRTVEPIPPSACRSKK